MIISEQIPLSVEDVISEIEFRQGLPWNDGRINDHYDFKTLNELFRIINSGIQKEDFMYQGDLYRIHTEYIMYIGYFDSSRERIIGTVGEDEHCFVLPYTQCTNEVVAYSKSPDFMKGVFYKVAPTIQAVILHANTGKNYGIDVNALYKRYGYKSSRYAEEQEVLFPITKDTLIKEYWCTPRQLKYYMSHVLAKK